VLKILITIAINSVTYCVNSTLTKMTLSTKPEVHNVLHCHHRRTEPWPQLTCTENFMKFGNVVFETCKWTDNQTNQKTHKC